MQKKAGRPTGFKPEYCKQLIDHMAKGFSFETFGATIGVHRGTLYDWANLYPEFAEAKSLAFDSCQLEWEKIGREYVINESSTDCDEDGNRSSQSKSLNASVWALNMKNRFKWRDKQPEEVEKVNVNVSTLSDEELKKILKEALEEK